MWRDLYSIRYLLVVAVMGFTQCAIWGQNSLNKEKPGFMPGLGVILDRRGGESLGKESIQNP